MESYADRFHRAGCLVKFDDIKDKVITAFKFIRGEKSDEDLLFRPEDSAAFANYSLMSLNMKRHEDNRALVLAFLVNIRKSDASLRRKQDLEQNEL